MLRFATRWRLLPRQRERRVYPWVLVSVFTLLSVVLNRTETIENLEGEIGQLTEQKGQLESGLTSF